MKVKEIMTTRVVTVTADTLVPVLASLLRENRVSGVPVVDADGAVMGLVREYDLLARGGQTAGEVMTASVISVSEDTDAEDVRHLPVERRIRRVPVMSGQRLAGIVSRGDVVALLTTECVCQVCGEAVRGQHPPPQCPKCHAGPERFVMQDPFRGTEGRPGATTASRDEGGQRPLWRNVSDRTPPAPPLARRPRRPAPGGRRAATARARGLDVKVGLLPAHSSDRGWLHGPGADLGVTKVVTDAGAGILVGGSVIGPASGEVTAFLALAIRARIPVLLLMGGHLPLPDIHARRSRRAPQTGLTVKARDGGRGGAQRPDG